MKKFWNFKKAAAKGSPHVIEIYEQIGEDWFSQEGLTGKAFAKQLKSVPKGEKILVSINSNGGNVWDGIQIYNLLNARRDDVTVEVVGVAASIASVIAMAGSRVRMPEASMLMVHRVWSGFVGNAAEMREYADVMEKHDNMLADIYAARTGLDRDEVLSMMDEETWISADEAKELGFADEVTKELQLAACAHLDFSRFRRVPDALAKTNNSLPATGGAIEPKDPTVNKTAILALLKKHGIELEADAEDSVILAGLQQLVDRGVVSNPDAQNLRNPPAQPAAQPADDVAARIAALEARANAEREQRIRQSVGTHISAGRIPVEQEEAWVRRAVQDESVLNDLAALPSAPLASAPTRVEVLGDSPAALIRHWGNMPCHNNGMDRAVFFNQHREKILFNTNTMPTQLQRQVILQDAIRAFAKRLAPLSEFSTVFRNVQLQGTDKIDIPYYALSSNSATAWNAGNGYVTGNSTTSYKEITVDQRYYVGLSFTSAEMRRQPFLDTQRLVNLEAEILANSVFAAVLNLVLAANFANTAKEGPAESFDFNDVVDVADTCDTAQWPDAGRSMLLHQSYYNALVKDLKDASVYGGTEAVRGGSVPNVAGFSLHKVPGFALCTPYTSQGLRGFAAFRSALLFALSPIEPAPAVRQQLARYEIYTDPQTGVSFEYKLFGNAAYDKQSEVVECNYGAAVGEGAALTRIVTG